MDRIEKFLNRKPVKNKRKVKWNGREYTITREDVKTIRSFKKNVCMDPDVDLYRPLKLSFSRKTMTEGLPIRNKKDISLEVQEKLVKRYKRGSRERRKEKSKNEIVDLWEDEGLEELSRYEQDIFVRIEEGYSGPVEGLEYKKEDLEKNLRGMYLRLYEPREGKEYKLKDLIKELPKPETLRPFPEDVGLYFEFKNPIKAGISKDFRKFGVADGRELTVYEFKSFLKLKSVIFDGKVVRIVFTKDESICVLLEDRICVIDDIYSGENECDLGRFYYQSFPTWEREARSKELNECENEQARKEILYTVIKTGGKINSMEVHPNGKYIGVVCGKTVVLYNLESRNGLRIMTAKGVTPLKIGFHRTLPRVVISTSNSLIIHDVAEKKNVCEAKEFSFILDFFNVTDDVILVTNNLNKIFLFNHSRNVTVRTMLQEDVATGIIQHSRYNLMCAVFPNEMIIFHNSLASNMVVPLKRIPGRYSCVSFHPSLPWLYAVRRNKLLVFT